MAVDIQNIVKLNFNIERPVGTTTYPTTILFVSGNDNKAEDTTDNLYTVLGGKKLKTFTGTVENLIAYKKEVAGTADDFICVVTDNANVAALNTAAKSLAAPNRIIILTKDGTATLTDKDDLVAYKVNDVNAGSNSALAIAAFYSQLDLDSINGVQDYCYTDESAAISNGFLKAISQADFDTASKNLNWTDKIGDKYVNFGGNMGNGTSITTLFTAIACENDVIYAVLKTMLNKQYLTDEGLTNVVGAIDEAMARYVKNGYLETNGVYTGETQYSDYGNYKGTLQIRKGQSLSNGYLVSTVPMSYITADDRAAKTFTPITIFMQTVAGARTVTINGKILA